MPMKAPLLGYAALGGKRMFVPAGPVKKEAFGLRTLTRRFALDEMVVVRERVLVERTRRTARTASL
jgi:hypothetical protein